MIYPPPVIPFNEINNLFPLKSIKIGICGYPVEPTIVIDQQNIKWLCDDSIYSLINFIKLVEDNMSKFNVDDNFIISVFIKYYKLSIMELYNEKISINIFNKRINEDKSKSIIKKINKTLEMYDINESITLLKLSYQNH